MSDVPACGNSNERLTQEHVGHTHNTCPPKAMKRSPIYLGLTAVASATLIYTVILANSAEQETPAPRRTPDVVYVPTPQAVVDKMLEMAEVKKGDVVYDLGCGDGRIVVTAAKKYGVKAVGFDINPQRVKESLENVRSNKVEHLVTIKEADIFTLDLSEPSVVTLYLLPDLNVKLMPQLRKLKPGSRIVSHDFDMRGAKPVQVQKVTASTQNSNVQSNGNDDEETGTGAEHTVYKWVVPWQPE
jgi:SAM-dependent methyltransferase